MIDDGSPIKTAAKMALKTLKMWFQKGFPGRVLIDSAFILEIADILTRRLSQVEKALGRSRLAN